MNACDDAGVVVLDASDLFAEVLAAALRLRGLAVRVATETGRPDVGPGTVVLLDPALAAEPAGESVSRPLASAPDVRIVLLVDPRAPGNLSALQGLSPVGWVSRDSTVDDVVQAISRAASTAQARGPAMRRSHSGAAAPHVLTRRELEILERVAVGATDDEVAAELKISVHTVRAHLQNVRLKLGVASRFAAVATARSAGLLPAPSPSPSSHQSQSW